jgi:hypothetical protein
MFGFSKFTAIIPRYPSTLKFFALIFYEEIKGIYNGRTFSSVLGKGWHESGFIGRAYAR